MLHRYASGVSVAVANGEGLPEITPADIDRLVINFGVFARAVAP